MKNESVASKREKRRRNWTLKTPDELKIIPCGSIIDIFCDAGLLQKRKHIKTWNAMRRYPPKLDFDVWDKYGIDILGTARHTKGYYHSRINENFYDMLIVRRGTMSAKSEGRKFKCSKSDALLLPSGILLDSYVSNNNTYLIWFHFHKNRFWQRIFADSVFVKHISCAEEIESLMMSFGAEIHGGADRRIMESIADAIFLNIVRAFDTAPKRGDIKTVAEEILANPSANWNARETAVRLNLSKPTLDVRFLEFANLTFAKFVLRARMERVLEYCGRKGYSNARLAEISGYANAYSFAKAFRTYYGCYPSSFGVRAS